MDIEERLRAELERVVPRAGATRADGGPAGVRLAVRRRRARTRAIGAVCVLGLVLAGAAVVFAVSGHDEGGQQVIVAEEPDAPDGSALIEHDGAQLTGTLWDGRSFQVMVASGSDEGCVNLGRTDLGCTTATTTLGDGVTVELAGDRGMDPALLWGFAPGQSQVDLRTEPDTTVSASMAPSGAFAIGVPSPSAITSAVLVVSGDDGAHEYDLADQLGLGDRSSLEPERVPIPDRTNEAEITGQLADGRDFRLTDQPSRRLCLTIAATDVGCQGATLPVVASLVGSSSLVYGWAPPATAMVDVLLFSTSAPRSATAQLSGDATIFALGLPGELRAGTVIARAADGAELWRASFTAGLPSFEEAPDPAGPDPTARETGG